MHTVELLEEAVQLAKQLGFNVRQEWLSGSGGGCEIKGKRWLFVDLSLSALEQLDQVLAALRGVADIDDVAQGNVSSQLRRALADKAAAA